MDNDLNQNKDKFLKELKFFLTSWSGLWNVEILSSYPESLQAYPHSWLNYLETLNNDELFLVDSKRSLAPLEGHQELYDWAQALQNWAHLVPNFSPQNHCVPKEAHHYPVPTFHKIKGKKVHEILAFANFIEHLQSADKERFNLVDIGGGQGHLCRTLCTHHHFHGTSIDRDSILQEQGQKRLEYEALFYKSTAPMNFLHHEFGAHSFENEPVKNIFLEADFTVGLHTCGPLALEHLKLIIAAKKNQTFVNLGCCYSRLDTQKDLNLSAAAQINPLHFSKWALTLASRAHSVIERDEFDLKIQVKKYRYLIHLWFKQQMNQGPIISVGDCHPRDYHGSFFNYLKRRLLHLKMELPDGENEKTVEAFCQDESIQKEIRKMFVANILRWHMGRAVEIFILLDRAIWIEELAKKHNLHVRCDLMEIFHEKISPRNIALTLYYKK